MSAALLFTQVKITDEKINQKLFNSGCKGCQTLWPLACTLLLFKFSDIFVWLFKTYFEFNWLFGNLCVTANNTAIFFHSSRRED